MAWGVRLRVRVRDHGHVRDDGGDDGDDRVDLRFGQQFI